MRFEDVSEVKLGMPFELLQPGDVFLYNNRIHMRLVIECEYNAVDLTTGNLICIYDSEPVLRCEATMKYVSFDTKQL